MAPSCTIDIVHFLPWSTWWTHGFQVRGGEQKTTAAFRSGNFNCGMFMANLAVWAIKSDYASVDQRWHHHKLRHAVALSTIMIQEGRGAKLQYHLLGLQPVQSIAIAKNDEAVAFASALTLTFSTKGNRLKSFFCAHQVLGCPRKCVKG